MEYSFVVLVVVVVEAVVVVVVVVAVVVGVLIADGYDEAVQLDVFVSLAHVVFRGTDGETVVLQADEPQVLAQLQLELVLVQVELVAELVVELGKLMHY